tara:strand:+ start:246 stop:1484 length:1239 start_codon:yes stop_codon:yes gene_type:complete
MAQPFFRGNYGSALGRVDTRPIIEAGRAQGQMFAQAGKDIGGMIKEYGLNKQKREEMTNEIESALKVNPDYLTRMTSTGIEADDKKAQTRIDKLAKGELKLSELKGLAGELAMMEKQDLKAQAEQTRLLAQRTALLNQKLTEENIAGKQRERQEAGKKDAFRDNYFTGLNKDLDEALDLLKSDPNAKLEPKFAKLVANQNMVRNKQGDLSFYQSDPTQDELKVLERTKLEGEILDSAQAREESTSLPLFKDNSEVLVYKENLPPGATAKFSKKGTGFDLDSITLTAEAKEEMTPVDGMPGYSLYKGGLYKSEEVEGKAKLTKVTAESFGQDVEMLERAIKISQTPELTEYGKARKLHYDRLDDGTYVYKDSNGDDVEVPFSSEYEDQLFELEKMKANYKKRLGDNLIDLRSR